MCADVELFEKLTSKRVLMRLARVALAAGKFPTAFEMCSGGPQREEECAVAFDHGGNDDFHAGERIRYRDSGT